MALEINPNIEIKDSPIQGKGYVALRDIAAGEELTADYAQFSTKDWEMKCSCGAKSCTGTVRGAL